MAIGEKPAAELYTAMLRDTLALAERATHGWTEWEVWLAYTPDDAFLEGPYSLAPFWEGQRLAQSGGDLGQRMFSCIDQLQSKGAKHVVLIGSDSPNLPPGYVSRAFLHLDPYAITTHRDGITASYADLVLGPAPDGGFYLIGVRSRVPEALFSGVDWSTENTLAQVMANADRLGLRPYLEPMWDDVDTIEDLQKLARRIHANRLHDCASATQEWLHSHDLPQHI